ncbi:MAG: hypothetical protein EXR62_12275 [Chloroflexi bacterium]|nr:hypothetical protein [Chloroflexota bacterium]
MFRWYRGRRQTFTSVMAIIFIVQVVLISAGVIEINFRFENFSLNGGAIVGLLLLAFIAIGELWEW